jgi:hypothetical protein
MCDKVRWFQFTVGRLLHATFWFGTTMALVTIGLQIPISMGSASISAEASGYAIPSVYLIILCLCASAITFGTGIGAILGRPFAGALCGTVIAGLFLIWSRLIR